MNFIKHTLSLLNESKTFMYHFTLRSKMWDIVEHTGLKARKGKGNASYSNEARIYLFPQASLIRKDMSDWIREKFGHKTDYTKDPKVALLKVDVSGLEIKHANLDEYYTNQDIPKEK